MHDAIQNSCMPVTFDVTLTLLLVLFCQSSPEDVALHLI